MVDCRLVNCCGWNSRPWTDPHSKIWRDKKIETDDVSLCFIIAFFCWLIPIIAFSILARTLGF
jgi:hypothetical protein